MLVSSGLLLKNGSHRRKVFRLTVLCLLENNVPCSIWSTRKFTISLRKSHNRRWTGKSISCPESTIDSRKLVIPLKLNQIYFFGSWCVGLLGRWATALCPKQIFLNVTSRIALCHLYLETRSFSVKTSYIIHIKMKAPTNISPQ